MTRHNTTPGQEIKSLAQSRPLGVHRQLCDHRAKTPASSLTLRRDPCACAEPLGGSGGALGGGAKASHVGREALSAISLQGLGSPSPAPGRALECEEGQTHKIDSTICKQEGGDGTVYTVRRGVKKTETQSSDLENHYLSTMF